MVLPLRKSKRKEITEKPLKMILQLAVTLTRKPSLTPMKISNDSYEERLVEQMEAECSQDSFIDDSTQLLYSQYPLSAPEGTISPGCDDGDVILHRRVNHELEKSNLFATPILNRRMRRSPGCSDESLAGLVNMCFIRSAIEHHRQGGGMTQVEIEFHRQHAGQQYHRSNEQPKSNPDKKFRDDSSKAMGCMQNEEKNTLDLERLVTLNSDGSPEDMLKISLDADFPTHSPNLSPTNNHHTAAASKCATASMSGTMADADIDALIEKNRQAA